MNLGYMQGHRSRGSWGAGAPNILNPILVEPPIKGQFRTSHFSWTLIGQNRLRIVSIIEIGSCGILIVISEVEQVSLVVIIEEEPNIQWDSNCDQ